MKNYMENYPRPQFLRPNWTNLDGPWDFAFDDDSLGEAKGWQHTAPATKPITVPFSYETAASGIGDEAAHPCVWYFKTLTTQTTEDRVFLHFEGSDYLTRLYVNGTFIGEHQGGYARFSFDITPALVDHKAQIAVCVKDSPDLTQPRGKQRWQPENFACWYVQTTGIWKSVWLEYAPATRITACKITPNLQKQGIELGITTTCDTGYSLQAEASFEGHVVNTILSPVRDGLVDLSLSVFDLTLDEWGLKKWSPQAPHLYDLKLTLLKDGCIVDTVLSYFGLREIRIEGNQVLLNGAPLYQRLILDQGYWRDSHLTPPNEAALVEDIDKILEMGYNGVRKHMKTEDERFLYWADAKGLLVWSEFPATYAYRDLAVERITEEWLQVVQQNYNHPSIITWTPFNESWGVPAIMRDKQQQSFTQAIYYLTKALDPMRPVVCNDGWEHTISDILTLHDYEERGETFLARYTEGKEDILHNRLSHNVDRYAFAAGFPYNGQPVIISEFGGIALRNGDAGWGYGNQVEGEDAFLERFDSITTAIKNLPYCCGYCYTQVTDVQQEINGLMDIDRNFKVDPARLNEINRR